MVEAIVRQAVELHPTSFFVEERRDGEVWVRDNPYFGYTFFHRAQARLPARNLFRRDKPADTHRILVLGESAAMGFPHPEFGLARMLAAHLGTQYPDQKIDVIDGTMTMINSHILREMALEAMTYQPDLVVIYAGNNEVVGPYGATGVFGGFRASIQMVRLDRWLRTHSALVRWLTSGSADDWDRPPQWLGLDHFVDTPVLATDARMQRTYAHFRRNINDITVTAAQAGIPVAVVTPAVNLDDWPPLHSFLPDPFPDADRRRWEMHRNAARQATSDGEWDAAVEEWRSAQMLVPGHAETAYELAVALARIGKPHEAMHWFEQACTWDGCRFRADQKIADMARSIADQSANVTLIDARPRLSVGPSRQDPVWLEHVHYSVSGMASLVSVIAPVAARLLALPEEGASTPDPMRALNFQPDIIQTSWSAVQQFLAMQVFRAQAGYAARLEDAARRHQAAARQADEVAVADIQLAHQEALNLGVAPLWLLDTLRAGYLERRQAWPEAIRAIESAAALMPHNAALPQKKGRLLFQAGDLDAALTALEESIQLHPYETESLNYTGLIWQRRGARERARHYYEKVLALDPNHASALNNLGYLHYENGQADEAIDFFRSALNAQPDLLEARYHLGLALLQRNEFEAAALQFREVVQRQPAFARAWSAWGVAEMQQGQTVSAVTRFARAIEEEPALVEPRVNWCYAQLGLGEYQQALPELVALLESYPDRPEIRYLYAQALTGTDQLERAIPEYQRAIRAAPHRTDWMLETARTLKAAEDGEGDWLASARELAWQAWSISRQTDAEARQLLLDIEAAQKRHNPPEN
jgi:tetratricopeptide (TPR) repeat protein